MKKIATEYFNFRAIPLTEIDDKRLIRQRKLNSLFYKAWTIISTSQSLVIEDVLSVYDKLVSVFYTENVGDYVSNNYSSYNPLRKLGNYSTFVNINNKVFFCTAYALSSTRDYIADSRPYQFVDKYLHITDALQYSSGLVTSVVSFLQNVIVYTYGKVVVILDTTTKHVRLIVSHVLSPT